jgi:cellulose synthase (UDP-forming)
MITYFDGWQKAFMFLLPSFVLVTGILPMAQLDWNFVARFLPWYVLSLWACEELGRGYARSWTIEQYNFLRSPGFAFATLTFFVNKKLRFRVTRKGGSSTFENLQRMSPQVSVIVIASVSLIVGVVQYTIAPHMALGALVLNVIWCLVTMLISTIAVRFALGRSKQERSSYRFQLPIPVRIRDRQGRNHILPVEDISSGGFSAVFPDELASDPGTTLEAQLILPSGASPVRLEILRSSPVRRPDGRSTQQTLAVKFAWPSARGVDALDLYLYGSNAEWQYCQLHEREPSPVDRFMSLIQRTRSRPVEHSGNWQPAIVVPADFSRSIEVLALSDDDAASVSAVLAHIPIKLGTAAAIILPHGREHIAYYRMQSLHFHEGNGRRMFLHRLSKLEALPQSPEVSKRREQADIRTKGAAA